MARSKDRSIGFNPERIVKIDKPKETTKSTKKNAEVNPAIQKLKERNPGKKRVFVYMDDELAAKVKEYGDQVGRANGGSSRIITEALKMYFKKYNL